MYTQLFRVFNLFDPPVFIFQTKYYKIIYGGVGGKRGGKIGGGGLGGRKGGQIGGRDGVYGGGCVPEQRGGGGGRGRGGQTWACAKLPWQGFQNLKQEVCLLFPWLSGPLWAVLSFFSLPLRISVAGFLLPLSPSSPTLCVVTSPRVTLIGPGGVRKWACARLPRQGFQNLK